MLRITDQETVMRMRRLKQSYIDMRTIPNLEKKNAKLDIETYDRAIRALEILPALKNRIRNVLVDYISEDEVRNKIEDIFEGEL